MALIQEVLARASRDTPEGEALVCGERRLSFADVDEASSRLAVFLKSNGVASGDRVGIFSHKCIEEVIALFAIAKAGGVFVPINPHFLEGQLAHVVADCGLSTLFASNFKAEVINRAYPERSPLARIISFSREIRLHGGTAAALSHLGTILAETPAAPLPAPAFDDAVAAVIYTSGSTGMPKGVIVTHKILHDSTTASAVVLENRPDDRLISVSPFAFDGALSQLFTAFHAGGTLVLQPSTFPADIAGTLRDERITGFHGVPSLWMTLLSRHSPFPGRAYPELRYISIIGERFPEKPLRELRRILPEAAFYMMYGTTEAFRSTWLPPDEFETRMGSCGIPFPGVEISIVGGDDSPLPPGEKGEIVHRGAFVSPGYWNDPDATARTFRGGALHTGDLGRLDGDGYLYFAGRMDGMIKAHGFRASPEEIEDCLLGIDGIREAAVTGIAGGKSGDLIKAVLSADEPSAFSEKEIREHCRKRLPYYMIPQVIEIRAELPRTASQKVDRSNL